jgi:hypothetical protein
MWTFREELIPGVEKMQEEFNKITRDPISRQQLIELLVTEHCVRMGNEADAMIVAGAINKHVKQLIPEYFREGW